MQCPYCWEAVGLAVDLSEGDAQYTHDCPVCCQPLRVTVRIDARGGYAVEAAREND